MAVDLCRAAVPRPTTAVPTLNSVKRWKGAITVFAFACCTVRGAVIVGETTAAACDSVGVAGRIIDREAVFVYAAFLFFTPCLSDGDPLLCQPSFFCPGRSSRGAPRHALMALD